MKLRTPLAAAILALSLTITACSSTRTTATETATTSSATATNASYDTTQPPTIAQAMADNHDYTTYNDNEWDANDAQELSDTTATITSAGVYRLSGDYTSVTITAADADVVLILDNATINGDITVTEAANVAISTTGTNTVNGAIDSSADLTFSGNGSLTVTATDDGISSADNLVILSGTITVTAGDDGIQANDALAIEGGTITITASGDALKSDKDDDPTKGYIYITGGDITITTDGDALAATTDILITDGKISITAGGSAATGKNEEISQKGLKAGSYIISEGGTIAINTADDALHSDGAIRLSSDSNVTLATGDDGVHTEVAVLIDGASVTITESVEGIEAGLITIADGDVDVTSSDDGINGSGSISAEAGVAAVAENSTTTYSTIAATSKNDMPDQRMPGRGEMPGNMPGGGAMVGDESTGEQVIISGGTVTVNAGGDGLDSNGDLIISGGTTTVWGPTDNGNGTIDYAGTFEITGGELIAVGSNGMPANPTSTDGQGWISASASGNAGNEIVISNSAGNEIARFSALKNFGLVQYSSSQLTNGETYTVSVNGTDTTITAGESTMGGPGGMGAPDQMGMPPMGSAPAQ
ncbi:carbohydrate-binding domain-containing protein [Corynebacterium kutscheri]|uniref:carbohydrate-binding domain-containing protein n=1 Tax=Corynebacterium kutscheri TaxID=35755 RepID=UPI0037C09229